MLRDLVERFLDSLTREREFDSTFLALLAAEGFFDVHFTHGGMEFGKDFVAKKIDSGVTYQYAFQNKAGGVGLSEWREIQGQMFQTLTNGIGGPSFDPLMPRRSVLVMTGRLTGAAATDHQQFLQTMNAQFTDRTVLPAWDRETLIELLLRHGPEQLFGSANDIAAYGAFYRLYGAVVAGDAKVDDIEKHFDERLRASVTPVDRIAAVAVEAHLFAAAARAAGQPYFALQAMLAVTRAVAFEMQSDEPRAAQWTALLRSSLSDVLESAVELAAVYRERVEAAGGMFEAAGGAGLFVTYPILCAHLMEALVLECVLGDDAHARSAAATLGRLVSDEPGCAHPISDRYAVSVAWSIRTLLINGYAQEARALLKESANWLIDRYWGGGAGLAACDADEAEEIAQLIGTPFSGVKVKPASGSLLACTLMDAACLLQDCEIFDGLRTDVLAAEIFPRYYQTRDTPGQFEYASEDIVRFPNVEFAEVMPPFENFAHGNHLDGESVPRLATLLGEDTYVVVSLLMRDVGFLGSGSRRKAPEHASDLVSAHLQLSGAHRAVIEFTYAHHFTARARDLWSEVLFDIGLADGPEHRSQRAHGPPPGRD